MDSNDRKLMVRLKQYLGRFMQRREDIEDIAQESILRVLEAGSKGEIRFPVAYLYRTVRNLALASLEYKYYKNVQTREYMDTHHLWVTLGRWAEWGKTPVPPLREARRSNLPYVRATYHRKNIFLDIPRWHPLPLLES